MRSITTIVQAPGISTTLTSRRIITTIPISAIVSDFKGYYVDPGPGYETEYQAILDRATFLGITLPSTANQVKQNAFLKLLKDLGIWTHLDRLRVFKYAGSLSFASIDWINPALTLTAYVNGPSFSDLTGFLPDGISSYANLGFTLASLTKFQQNDASAFAYCTSLDLASGVARQVFGGAGGAGMQFGSNGTTVTYSIVSDPSSNVAGLKTADGLSLIQRLNAPGPTKLFQNGASFNAAAFASQTRDNTYPVYVGCRNASGTPQQFSATKVALFGIGDGLSGLEAALKTATDIFYAS